jgi:hypothetical protein
LNNLKLFLIGSKKISLLGATNQNAPNAIQRQTWRDTEMRLQTPRIESGMPPELRAIGAPFIKLFKDFQDTIIQ